MYLDEKKEWRPPERLPERPARPEITGRQKTVISWVVAANLFAMLIAPIGGASLIHAIGYWVSG